jgi:hypothetical protein
MSGAAKGYTVQIGRQWERHCTGVELPYRSMQLSSNGNRKMSGRWAIAQAVEPAR